MTSGQGSASWGGFPDQGRAPGWVDREACVSEQGGGGGERIPITLHLSIQSPGAWLCARGSLSFRPCRPPARRPQAAGTRAGWAPRAGCLLRLILRAFPVLPPAARTRSFHPRTCITPAKRAATQENASGQRGPSVRRARREAAVLGRARAGSGGPGVAVAPRGVGDGAGQRGGGVRPRVNSGSGWGERGLGRA